MPRRKYKSPIVKPDLIYSSIAIAKLINLVMKDGKKSIAEGIVYQCLDELKKKNMDPVGVIETIINNVGPRMVVKARRVGGASYMVPRETTTKHRLFLGLSWLVEGSRMRSNKEFHTFTEKLLAEILDAYNNKGAAVDKKLQTEKLAEQNKVFAHFGRS